MSPVSFPTLLRTTDVVSKPRPMRPSKPFDWRVGEKELLSWTRTGKRQPGERPGDPLLWKNYCKPGHPQCNYRKLKKPG